jgi:hypothetical protein
LIRDWLTENKIYLSVGKGEEEPTSIQLDYDVLELGKSYANNKASTNQARIDVDILSAIDELSSLGLLEVVQEQESLRFKTKDDQTTRDNIQQSWSEVLAV